MFQFNLGRSVLALTGRVAGISAVAVLTLFASGCGQPDALSGYYMLQVNPAPDAPQDKLSQTNMLFAMDRLAFNQDHTYRFGPVSGDWQRLGNKVTLTPKTVPKTPPYAQTTMADAITILLQRAEFQASADSQKLVAVNAPKGAIVFQKMSAGMH